LEKAVQDALGVDGFRLLFDLSECPYLDSGGLSVLLFAFRQVRNRGWIGVIEANRNILRLFEITGLSDSPGFRVFADSSEARAASHDTPTET
jgi:anti-anti-sigma factor